MQDEPEIVKILKEEEINNVLYSQAPVNSSEEENDLVHESESKSIFHTTLKKKDTQTNLLNEQIHIHKQQGNLHENKFKLITEHTTDFISIITFSQPPLYTYVSPSYKKILGYNSTDMIGKSLYHFIHPNDKEKIKPMFNKYLKKRDSGFLKRNHEDIVEKFHCNIKDASGIYHYTDVTANIVGNEIVLVAKDISDEIKAKKLLEESEKKYRLLLENSLQGFVIAQNDPIRLSFVSKQMEQITGYTCEELEHFGPPELQNLIHPEDQQRFFSNFQKRISGASFKPYDEYKLIKKNGETRWIELYSTRIEYKGSPATQTVFLDITDKKKAEEKIREDELLFKDITENYPNSIISIIEQNYTISYTSGQEYRNHHIDPKTIIGKTVEQLYGNDSETIKQYFSKTFDGEEQRFELLVNNQHQLFKTTPLKKHDGSIQQILVVVENITQQKQLEEELRESKKHFQMLFNLMVDPVVIINKKGTFLEVTDKVEEITGWKKTDLLGKNFLASKILTKKSKMVCISNLMKRMSGAHIDPYQVEVITKQGTIIPFEINAHKISYKGKHADMVVFRDISLRLETEKALRDNEKQLAEIVNGSSIPSLVINKNHVITRWNKALEKLTGYSAESMIGTKNQWTPFYQEKRPIFCDLLMDSASKKEFDAYYPGTYFKSLLVDDSYEAEDFFPSLGETGAWLHITSTLLKDSDEKPVGAIETFQDISKQKKAEILLKKHKEKLKIIVQKRTHELEQRIKELNCLYAIGSLAEQSMVTVDDIINGALEHIPEAWQYPDITCCCIFLHDKKYYSNGFIQTEWKISSPIVIKGKNVGYVAVYYSEEKPLLDEGPFRIHERKLLNAIAERLGHIIERMESEEVIKQLVKQKDEFIHMLSHDLKNPMTPILTLLPVIHKRISDDQIKEMIQNVIHNTKRMQEIINETLKLARLEDYDQTIELTSLCLYDQINTVIKQNQSLLEKHAFHVINKIDPSLYVNADTFQFGELFSNFLTNAVKYTHQETRGQITIDAIESEGTITISVSDNGVGLTPEQQKQVFNKFFKAGSPRKGMSSSGLGLSICENIVKKLHGKIWVESPGVNKGSTFYVTLQATKPEKNEKKPVMITQS